MKNLTFSCIFVFLFSCSDSPLVKEKKFDYGEIKSKEYFYSQEDSIPYKVISYYTTGVVKDTLYYNSKARLNGVIYTNNKEEEFEVWNTFLNGKKMD